MFNLCDIDHQATSVELSAYCNFFNANEKSLVIAGANIIRVFRLVPEFPFKNVLPLKKEEDELPPKVKMECMANFVLQDTVVTLGVVSLKPARDTLLLGFKDAKLSVVEYDPQTHSLKTISLHYFENEDVKGGRHYNPFSPIVRVDPETRCASMLIYQHKIVVLPFRKELATEQVDYTSPLARGAIMQSYIIDPKDFEAHQIDNIIDMQFLHGYYDPTLAILYEPIKTFPGRVAVRQDTFCLAAISLNLRQRLHPVIWAIQNLPFDCLSLLAVPKPIGGVLLFAANSLTYLTQSVPPYGISVNSLGDKNTNFPLRKQEGIVISLSNSTAQFLTEDRIVISLKGGELYVLTLVADSMRSIRSFHFDRAASSVLTCCMSVCEGQYLFLGSRLGNSLLLRFTEKEVIGPLKIKNGIDPDQPPPKKKKLLQSGSWMATDVKDIEDPVILEVYGQEETSAVQALASYRFEVMDSLLNIGPCGTVSMGEPAFLSQEFDTINNPSVELVSTSGYGKNGALSVLQRSIKPQILTTFDIPGVVDMWSLVGKADDRRKKDPNAPKDHSYLVLSREQSGFILKTDEEISELDDSGFNISDKTIFAGNIGSDKFIVQVTPYGIRLLDGITQIQHLIVDVGTAIVSASIADPYLIVLTECGSVVICTLITQRYQAPKLTMKKIQGNKKSRLIAISAYCDRSGLFTTDFPDDGSLKRKVIKTDAEIKKELDDEDEMLYASAKTSVFDPPKSFLPQDIVKITNKWWRKWKKEPRLSYWVAGVKETGELELYLLPDFTCAFVVENFWIGHKILVDSKDESNESTKYPVENIPIIHEVLLTGMGFQNMRPVLFARVDQDLLMYEAFPFSENIEVTQLKVRFRLVEHNMIIRESRTEKIRRRNAGDPEFGGKVRLKPFSNVSVYSGVFICGMYPYWVILTVRGEFRYHPMRIDGPVRCFSPFRNVNCQNGFIYMNKEDSLRICLLPSILSYDAPWPVRKVPLRCTPHFVAHHLETKTYCVVTSNSEATHKIWKFNGDDKEEFEEERDDRFIKVEAPIFTAQLFSPVNWQVIPNTDFDFERWEHVTTCKNVLLSYEGDRSGLRGYIAIGTTTSYGEDITCRGRILIFDVIDVVPEPGQPLTKNRLKTLYDAEQKGPITEISYCHGNLITAMGQKVYIWQMKDRDLVGIAFIDTPIYVHRLLTLKNLIYCADICKSVFILRFQEESRTLSIVSKDPKPMDVYSIDFLVDNNCLGFIASDAEKNITVFRYLPDLRESVGGSWLVRKGDYNVGHRINSFFRLKCTAEITDDGEEGIKHMTYFATLEGGIGHVLPISEKAYRRIAGLYNLLHQGIPHIGGLNPKACRAVKPRYRLNIGAAKGILDWSLVKSYLHQPSLDKAEMAKKIGSKVDDLIETIINLDRAASHF